MALAAGCTEAPQPSVDVKSDTDETQEATSRLQNREVCLVAGKSYNPVKFQDGSESFKPPIPIVIPAEIPVVEGSSGRQSLSLTLVVNGEKVRCEYRGPGDGAPPSSDEKRKPHARYVYASCSDGSTPGTVELVSELILHIDDGDKAKGPTKVQLKTQCPDVTPVLEKVCRAPGETPPFVARFGYSNQADTPVTIPVGSLNRFSNDLEPADRGQPRIFLPGRQKDMFAVPFDGSKLVWNVLGRTITASSANAQTCAPEIIGQPASVTASVGERATFPVKLWGVTRPSFQWQKDGANVPGAEEATLRFDAVKTTDAGSYRLVVTDGTGPVLISTPANLTVKNQAITVLNPNGDQRLVSGTIVPIGWAADANRVASVVLEYAQGDRFDRWTSIATVARTDPSWGRFGWRVPAAAAGGWKVRVRASDNANLSDVSDRTFTVEPFPNRQYSSVVHGRDYRFDRVLYESDGRNTSDVFAVGDLRQGALLLGRADGAANVLPQYDRFVRDISETEALNQYRNGLVLAVANVPFHSLSYELGATPQRFFLASLSRNRVSTNLVTFLFPANAVFVPAGDAVTSVDLQIEGRQLTLRPGDAVRYELQSSGVKTVLATVRFRSGFVGTNQFVLEAQPLRDGSWSNSRKVGDHFEFVAVKLD